MNPVNNLVSLHNPTYSAHEKKELNAPWHARNQRVYVGKKRSHVQKRHNTRSLLGIDISLLNWSSFLKTIEEALTSHSMQKKHALFVATVNPEFIVNAQEDVDFFNILDRTSLNTADGSGVCFALKGLYQIRQQRITGSDSTEKICKLAAKYQKSVFLLGAAEGVAQKAAVELQKRIPNLLISGVYSPKNRGDGLESYPKHIQRQLRSSDILFVALGAPAQEKWIARHLDSLPNCKVAMGIGGTLDFIAGKVRRAPQWMQMIGLEWLYRLVLTPSRWRRMLKIPIFISLTFTEWIHTFRHPFWKKILNSTNPINVVWQIPLVNPNLKRF